MGADDSTAPDDDIDADTEPLMDVEPVEAGVAVTVVAVAAEVAAAVVATGAAVVEATVVEMVASN